MLFIGVEVDFVCAAEFITVVVLAAVIFVAPHPSDVDVDSRRKEKDNRNDKTRNQTSAGTNYRPFSLGVFHPALAAATDSLRR